MEDQFDFEFFVERPLHVHQAAGGGKLMQFNPHLAPVGQSDECQDRARSLIRNGRPGSWRALPAENGFGAADSGVCDIVAKV